ncbi:hypothetical protein O3S81_03350 [Agrobacterium sp. SOY23]|uniref:hypothetical protein n=1 Tax=Agrobacterium sp. SOY23 TaxID=3014555 RepID=UPI0022AFEDEF|nr:hypothetical protein [Agrobacterium sp. SOY23]MCZ4428729.1 hypothetical protein [Agrobacterium sp. SOY23]
MIRRAHLLVACALLAISVPLKDTAEDTSSKEINIGFGVLLDGSDPIAGTAICEIGKSCRLVDKESPKIRVEVTPAYESGTLVTEMRVRCEPDCSLANGQSRMRLQSQRELDLFSGKETGIFTLLVSKPRKTIGKILLIYPDH